MSSTQTARSSICAVLRTGNANDRVSFTIHSKKKFQLVSAPRGTVEHNTILSQWESHPRDKLFTFRFTDLLNPDRLKSCVKNMLSGIFRSSLYHETYQFLEQKITNDTARILNEQILHSQASNYSGFRVIVEVLTVYYDQGREADDETVSESMEVDEQVVEVPALKMSIEALERKEFIQKGDKEGCAVCVEEFLNGMCVTEMPCSHIFHQDCIVRWLEQKNTCPVCRFQMPIE